MVELSYDTGSCLTFLDELVDPDGTLTKLDIDLYRFKDPEMGYDEFDESELPGLYQEIARSNETLEELQIKFGSNGSNASLPEMWDLVTSCSSLSSLGLFCFEVTADEELQSPSEVPSFQLNKLRLRLWSNAEDDLDWLVDWVGSDLETLELSLQSDLQWSKISSDILSTVFERSSSLKLLKLADLTLMSFSVPTSTQLLPNLQSLSVTNLSVSGYELILEQSMPQLQDLAFKCSIPSELVDVKKLMKAFSNLLKSCRQSLISLELRTDEKGGCCKEYEGPKGEKNEVIVLSQLQKLDISSSTEHALHLIENFELSQLKKLRVYRSCINLQFVSKILRSTQLATLSFNRADVDLSNPQLEFTQIF